MPSNYDLVVLGGSLEGRIAAITAVNYGARVALVEPLGLFDQRQKKRYLLQALQQLAKGALQQEVVQCFKSGVSVGQNWDWRRILEWSAIAANTQNPELSPAVMNANGIDVILEMPERLSAQLVVTTESRKLKARGILAAFGTVPLPLHNDSTLPSSTGIDSLLSASKLPESITIWGDSAEAVMWAEALGVMGVLVTLVSERFLRYEDWDVRALVRSQLITSGIKIISPAEFLQHPNISCSLRFGRSQPALVLPDFVHSLTRPKDWQAGETCLASNDRLQTSHPRVFACGSLLSGFPMHETVAIAEAKTAVRNALFFPTRQMRYGKIPEGYGRFARVGLTPRFAREGRAPRRGDRAVSPEENRGYGSPEDWQVWMASSPNSTDLSRTTPWPSYCKLICYDGRLQSIHLLGEGASELIQPLAATIGRPIGSIVNCLPETDGLVGLVWDAVRRSQQYKRQPGHWQRNWAENWFNWRRNT